MEESLQIQGFFATIADRLSGEMNHPIELVLRPYARAQLEMTQTPASFTFMADNTDIRAIATPISHIADLEIVIMSRDGLEPKTLDDFEGTRVAKIKGTRLLNDFDTIPNVDVFPVTNPINQLLVLLDDRVDAIVGAIPNWIHAKQFLEPAEARRLPLDNLFHAGSVPIYIWVPIGSEESAFTKRPQSASENLKNSGYYESIIAKSFPEFTRQ